MFLVLLIAGQAEQSKAGTALSRISRIGGQADRVTAELRRNAGPRRLKGISAVG